MEVVLEVVQLQTILVLGQQTAVQADQAVAEAQMASRLAVLVIHLQLLLHKETTVLAEVPMPALMALAEAAVALGLQETLAMG